VSPSPNSNALVKTEIFMFGEGEKILRGALPLLAGYSPFKVWKVKIID
jgi:hypothetical protein